MEVPVVLKVAEEMVVVPKPDIVPVSVIVDAPVMSFALAITVPDIVSPALKVTLPVVVVKLAGAVPEAAAASVVKPLD